MKKNRFYYGDDLSVADLEVVILNEQLVAVGNTKHRKKLPRVTICGIYDDEEQTMTFGVTKCSEKDIFIKSIGRELAIKRAEESPYRIVRIKPFQKVSEVFMMHATDIEQRVLEFGVTNET